MRRSAIILSLLALIALSARPGFTGGARRVAGTSLPMAWDNSVPIVYNPDAGPLGLLTQGQADALVAASFARWAAIPNVELSFTAGARLPANVNAIGLPANNPAHWAHIWGRDADGLSPVIYDADGSIVDDMFGVGARFDLLGAATIDTPIAPSGVITEATIVLNGAFLDGAGLPSSPPDAASALAFEATAVHEAGHFINLDHSLVNHEMGIDFDPDNDVYLPTMYPLTVLDEEAIASLNPDDEAAALSLYPGALAAISTAEFSGILSAGGTPLQGGQVIARRSDDPRYYAYEAISGARFFPCNVGGLCYPCDPFGPSCNPGNPPERGEFALRGLPAGVYTLCAEQLDRRIALANGTFIGPLPTPALLPGPEDCWDASESTTEDPDTADPIVATAGGVYPGLDIILDDLPASDSFEPNNTLGTASDLPGLLAMQPGDTIGATLLPGDLDIYQVAVVAGHTYAIDIEAAEIGSTLDPVMGLYDANDSLMQIVDDGIDPDSGMGSPDPALVWRATFTGLLKIVLASYPDLDLNGTGGTTPGPYWLRVIHDQDADGDSVVDRLDAFPDDPDDDADDDGVDGPSDNCPWLSNPGQDDADEDGHGDACDAGTIVSSAGIVLLDGDAAGARLGQSLAAADTDQDGRADLVAGMPGFPDAATMDAKGAWRLGRGTPAGPPGIVFGYEASGSPGSHGFAVSAGDLSCDGAAEVIVGDPIDDVVRIHNANDPRLGLTASVDLPSPDPSPFRYGHALSIAGDVNGDGASDLLVSDADHSTTLTLGGRVWLFAGTPPPGCALPDATPDWSVGGGDFERLGAAVAAAGDVNGDGYDDVIVGAPGDVFGYPNEGRALVFHGSPAGLSLAPDRIIVGGEADAHAGSSVAGLGDVNDDSYDDVAVGVPDHDAGGSDRGRVLIYYGSPTGLPATPSLTLDGTEDGARFGAALAGGSLDGDAASDLVVGAPDADAGGTGRGRVFVYAGSASGLSATPVAILDGLQDGARFGFAVALGDLNGDDRLDLLAGAPNFDAGQVDEGRVYLYLGTAGADRDGDGVADVSDNCDEIANPTQADSDVAEGPDLACDTADDSHSLFGADGLCGTIDDIAGDGRGDACAGSTIETTLTMLGYRSESAAWGDYDGDGDIDLWLSGVPGASPAPERLLRNEGGVGFADVTPVSMNGEQILGAWGDYDNDGDLDLLSLSAITNTTPAQIPPSCPEFPAVNGDGVLCESFETDRNLSGSFEFTRLPIAGHPTDPLRANGDTTDDVLGFTIGSGPSPVGVAGTRCSSEIVTPRPACEQPVFEENDWHLHSPLSGPGAGYDPLGIPGIGAPDGGKAHGGVQSLHMGRHLDASTTTQDTTRYRQVSAFVLDSQGNGDPNPGVVIGPATTLEFWQIMSTLDDENVGAGFLTPNSAFGGGQIQISLLGFNGLFERWRPLTPTVNGYDSLMQNTVGICEFDPGDDFVAPNDETMCDLGPAWADIGDIFGTDPSCAVDTDSNDTTHKDCGDTSDRGPSNIQTGSLGAGVWARSAFDLSPHAGKVARLRWLYMQGGGWSFGISRSALEPQPGFAAYQYFDGDDGWYIDDIMLTDLRQAPPLGPVGGDLRLLKNLGNGVFTDATPLSQQPRILWAGWIDFDRDGDLDIYTTSENGATVLRNDGGDTFIGEEWGAGAPHDRAWFQDYDGDDDTDMMVHSLASGTCALYRKDSGLNLFWVGDLGAVSCATGDWGDYDNDGDPDFAAGTQILRNDGGAGFSVVPAFASSPVRWADHDNDGDLDAAGGRLARNDGGDIFTPVAEASGRSHGAVLPADFDGDGRLDLLLPSSSSAVGLASRLLRNVAALPGNWTEIDLRGSASNTYGIGAIVTATAAGVTRRREVGAGMDGDPARIHIGLGDARVVETLLIRWPSGNIQTLANLPVNQRVTVQEMDGTPPEVIEVIPGDAALDVSLNTDIVFRLSEAIDPQTAGTSSIGISRNGAKVAGKVRLSADGRTVTFDPVDPLAANAAYMAGVTSGVRDLSGNAATPFTSRFDTRSAAGSLPLPAGTVGTGGGGSVTGGANQDDAHGFAAAAVEDVNGDGIGDIVIGSPNADNGPDADAGAVSLVFGQGLLQSIDSFPNPILYVGEGAGHAAGKAVARAGDLNGDNLADFLIGAPLASPAGAGSGKAYLVFGNAGLGAVGPTTLPLGTIAACALPTHCGIIFEGEAGSDQAGLALTAAGDINDDGFPDLLIAAPGASPSGRAGAGKVYLVYGPLATPGVVPLSSIGVSRPGLVFIGESAGDAAGASVSAWNQFAGDGVDDLLIGAPLADALDIFGTSRPDAGLTYAIHGGAANLVPAPVSPATIDLARVANGQLDQVNGVVFIGGAAGRLVGRSVTGEVDIDGDQQPDIVIGANLEVWIIPGDDPKTRSGTSGLDPRATVPASGLVRQGGTINVLQDFDATILTPGFEGDAGDLTVGAGGDVDGDGVDDLIIGAPSADPPGLPDAGKAWLIFGSETLPQGELLLSDIGTVIPGVVIHGAEPGDGLGASVGGGADLNGDGVDDILLGAPFADALPSTPPDGGEVYILSPLPPDEVPLVTFENETKLEWEPADRAVAYNIYRGLVSDLWLAGQVHSAAMPQLACGWSADVDGDTLPDLTDASLPAVDDALFYLVTGRNLFGESLLGSSLGSPPRVHDGQCP